MRVALVCPLVWDRFSPPFWAAALAGALRGRADVDLVVHDQNADQRDLGLRLEEATSDLGYGSCFGPGDVADRLMGWTDVAPPSFARIAGLMEESVERSLTAIDWASCAVVGIGMSFSTWPVGFLLAKAIKERYPEVKIVLGGEQAAFWLEYGARFSLAVLRMHIEAVADYVLLGEADQTFPLLIEATASGRPMKAMSGVAALAAQVTGAPRRARQTRHLESLSPPDYSVFNLSSYTAEGAPRTLYMEIGRGCPYSCGFCAETGYWVGYRHKALERLVNEYEALLRNFRPQVIEFTDSLLQPEHPVTQKFLQYLAERRGSSWGGYVRLASLNEMSADLLAKSGCHRVTIGVESASPRVIRAMEKHSDVHDSVPLIRLLAERGIAVKANLVLGFPGEDESSLAETVSLAERLLPFVERVDAFQYLPTPFSNAVESRPMEFRAMFTEVAVQGSMAVGPGLQYRPAIYTHSKTLNEAFSSLSGLGVRVQKWPKFSFL